MKSCPYCGTLLEDNAQTCSNCKASLGMSQFPQQNQNSQDSEYGIPAIPYKPNIISYPGYYQQQNFNGQQTPNGGQVFNGQQMPNGYQTPNSGYYQAQQNISANNQTPGKKEKNKRGCCLPLVIVGVIVLILGVIGIGLSGNNSSKQTRKIGEVTNATNSQIVNNNSSNTINENIQTIYKVGDILQDGNMKIVYVASGDYHEDNQFLQPKEGNKYIFLRFVFINEGKTDNSISFYSFNAYADGYACDMHYSTDETLSATLSSGRSTSGDIAFEVPSNATEIEIEYSPNFLSSKKIKFVYEGNKDSGYVLESNTSRTEGAYKVGDVITSNDLKITYLSSETYVSDNMFIQPKSGYHYVSTELEFENIGNSDKTISSLLSFDCYADGKAVDQTYSRDNDISGTIAPGRKIKGTVTFEVPDNAKVIELEYKDNLLISNRIVFTIK